MRIRSASASSGSHSLSPKLSTAMAAAQPSSQSSSPLPLSNPPSYSPSPRASSLAPQSVGYHPSTGHPKQQQGSFSSLSIPEGAPIVHCTGQPPGQSQAATSLQPELAPPSITSPRGSITSSVSRKLRSSRAQANQKQLLGGSKALAGVRVLLAEDVAMLQRLAVLMLSKMGAKVVAVSNGEEAVAAVTRSREARMMSQRGSRLCGEEDGNEEGENVFDVVLMDCQVRRVSSGVATRYLSGLAHLWIVHSSSSQGSAR